MAKKTKTFTWSQFGDQPCRFPVVIVKRGKRGADPFTVSVERVGQWCIVPVFEREEDAFAQARLIGWTTQVPDANGSPALYCAKIYPSRKRARAWAEIYRLYPLSDLTPLLEDPREFALVE